MEVLIRAIAGILLIAHGLVHLLYLARDVPEFHIEDSWVVPEAASRSVAVGLITATIVASVLLGLVVWGVPWLSGIWPAIAIAAAVTSMVLLVSFWDVRLLFGIALDVAIVAVAVMQPAWTDRFGA